MLRYDKTEAVTDVLDDVISVALLRELLTWAESDPLMRRLADPSRCAVLLVDSRNLHNF